MSDSDNVITKDSPNVCFAGWGVPNKSLPHAITHVIHMKRPFLLSIFNKFRICLQILRIHFIKTRSAILEILRREYGQTNMAKLISEILR
jgi:hypothetical protein